MNKKIKVFLRHWNGAIKRKQHIRPNWFSYEKCYKSVKNADVDLYILLDGNVKDHHFKFEPDDNITEYIGGSDEASFLFCLNTIKSYEFDDEDIIYIVEDDYLHRPGWERVMQEAFDSFDVDYVTLYDHGDKYTFDMYQDLQSKILHTSSVHWRTTPSTCNTYAGKWKTFKKHWDIHYMYCLPQFTHGGYDHTKFLHLWKEGSNLISSIPGFSNHCDLKEYWSPIVDWDTIQSQI